MIDFDICYKYRYIIAVVILIGCILLWPGVQKSIQIDNDLKSWFLENDPSLLAYHEFHDKFGNDEVLVLVVHNQEGLLTSHWQSRFDLLEKTVSDLDYISEIFGPSRNSLTKYRYHLFTNLPFVTQDSDPEQIRLFFEAVPTLRDQVYSSEYTTARFVIRFSSDENLDIHRSRYLAELEAITDHIMHPATVYRGGLGVVFSAINDMSQRDFGRFMIIGYILILLCIYGIYRQWRVVILAISTVVLAIWITLGLYGYSGNQLNMLTVLMPLIITLLGIMDVMHVMNEYSSIDTESGNADYRAIRALKHVYKPCLFTTLTTMASFLALLSSPMSMLRIFGLFSAIGIFFSLFFTYAISFLLLPSIHPSRHITLGTIRFLSRFFDFSRKHKTAYTLIFSLVLLVCIAGMSKLHTDTHTYAYLPPHHPVVQHHERIEYLWGPYMQYELMVKPKNGYELYDPEVVESIVIFADSVSQIPGIGAALGFHSLYEMYMEARYPDQIYEMMRDDLSLTEAHLYYSEHEPKALSLYMHGLSGTGRITFTGGMLSASGVNEKTNLVLNLSDQLTSEYSEIIPSGFIPMYSSIVGYINVSQIRSLFLAILLIFLMIVYFVRSFRLAIISVLPNFFPILIMFAVMGWFGINVDNATASFAAIALSFCIDDTIHFIYHYKKLRELKYSVEKAVRNTLSHVGTVIIYTSIVLFSGFALMILGELKTIYYFGVLVSAAIVAALVVQLALFPLLLCHFDSGDG